VSAETVTGGGSGLEEGSLSGLAVKLEIFEGPLDLLLHLIRENKVEITDIPIASITEQYLGYLELMKSLNLDVAGEFLVMAATLMHIKSRMLLPADEEEGGEEEGEDPRLELVRQLQEYQKYKEAGSVLGDLEERRSYVFTRDSVGAEVQQRTEYPLEVSLFELLGALRKLLETVPERSPLEIPRDHLTVAEKVAEVLDLLQGSTGEVAFEDLFRGNRTLSEIVVTFLALLELVRLRMVRTLQAVPGGRITVVDIRPAEEGAAEPAPPEGTGEGEGGAAGEGGESLYREGDGQGGEECRRS